MTRHRLAGVIAGVIAAGLGCGRAFADSSPPPAPPTPGALQSGDAGSNPPPKAEEKKAEEKKAEERKAGPAAPAAGETKPAASPDPRDQLIEELRKTVEDLKRRVEELEKRPAPPETPAATPPAPTPAPAGAGGGATFIPNISAVGNIQFRGGDRRITPNRGQFNFDEFEIAFQDAVTPSLRYDVFINAEKGEDWKLGLEEGYLTATRLAQHLTARLGRIRVPFGKVNPTHPHVRPYIDQPAPMTAFLGPDGLISDGAVLEYLLPTGKKLFSRVELGRWQTTSDFEDGLGFNGGRAEAGAWSGRLYLGKEVGRDKELEVGFSRYSARGRAGTDVGPSRPLAVNGVDLTFRSFPGSYKRVLYQAELMSHDTGEFGGPKTRIGGYLLAAYKWSQFWEAGARADYTQYPWPISGHEAAAHLFLTKYITEQTSIRMQLTHGSAPGFSSYNQILFQVLFGSGPHTHPLQ